jgi:hypothetical protein
MNLVVNVAQAIFGLGIGPQDQRRSVKRPDPIEGEFNCGPALGHSLQSGDCQLFARGSGVINGEGDVRRIVQGAHRGKILEDADPVPQ